jgi:hypothetical protein
MYFARNWEFGSALSKLRNFGGGGGVPPRPTPRGRAGAPPPTPPPNPPRYATGHENFLSHSYEFTFHQHVGLRFTLRMELLNIAVCKLPVCALDSCAQGVAHVTLLDHPVETSVWNKPYESCSGKSTVGFLDVMFPLKSVMPDSWRCYSRCGSDLLRAGRSGDRIPIGARFFAPVHNRPEAHPTSYTMGTRSFSGVKRPGRGVDHPPPPSAEVNEIELYTFSPSGPSWPVTG